MFEEEQNFRDYINDFIYKVFNYYNVKINIFNKAVLRIDWVNHYGKIDKVLAYSAPPNKIVIFPNIIRASINNMYNLMINIIECIIHELYHTDQLIDYTRMVTGHSDYVYSIEAPVEVETNLYILNHIKEIYDIFGVDISMDYNVFLGRYKRYDVGFRYIRRDYLSHLLVCFKGALFSIDDFRKLELYVEWIRKAINGRIFLEINGITYYLYHDGEYFDLNDLNKFLNNTIYNGDIIYSEENSVIIENGKCIIRFNDLNSTKIMC